MKRNYQTSAPSRLTNLNGDRKPGSRLNMIKGTRPPKLRFHIGDSFQFEGSIWSIKYIYRVKDKPNEWLHCLEECRTRLKESSEERIADDFQALGVGGSTPRIVYDMFRGHSDADMYFSDIYRNGSSIVKSTQKLLSMKKV